MHQESLNFLADLRAAPNQFDLAEFSSIAYVYQDRNTGAVTEVVSTLKGLTCEGDSRCGGTGGILVRTDLTNWQAATVLYHESIHFTRKRAGEPAPDTKEEDARYRHELFAYSMGWPELIRGSRTAGIPDPSKMAGQTNTPTYRPELRPGNLIAVDILGASSVPTNGWMLP